MAPVDVDQMEDVLRKTEGLIARTTPDQADRPTPCRDWDVATLTNHLVGYLRIFAANLSGRAPDVDPETFEAGPDAASEYREAADESLKAWRSGIAAGEVTLVGGPMPGPDAFHVMFMEEIVHGWDLARATGQEPPYDDASAQLALDGARRMIQPAMRGEWIGPEVEVADDAPVLDRLAAFSGRDPAAAP